MAAIETPMQELNRRVLQGRREIVADVIEHAVFPATGISCFADLHDYVDANHYGGLTIDPPADLGMANAVQQALDVWIRGRGIVMDVARRQMQN